MADGVKDEWTAELQVDGAGVPMNEFVRGVVVEVVLGLVRSLKGVPQGPAQVSIKLTRGS